MVRKFKINPIKIRIQQYVYNMRVLRRAQVPSQYHSTSAEGDSTRH
jgi:hypothetical protein